MVAFGKLYSVLSWRFNITNGFQKCNESPHKHRSTGVVDLHALGKKETQLFDQTNGLEVASGRMLVITFDGLN